MTSLSGTREPEVIHGREDVKVREYLNETQLEQELPSREQRRVSVENSGPFTGLLLSVLPGVHTWETVFLCLAGYLIPLDKGLILHFPRTASHPTGGRWPGKSRALWARILVQRVRTAKERRGGRFQRTWDIHFQISPKTICGWSP